MLTGYGCIIGWTVADIDPQGQTSLVTAFKSENHIAFAALVERESFENIKYDLKLIRAQRMRSKIFTLIAFPSFVLTMMNYN